MNISPEKKSERPDACLTLQEVAENSVYSFDYLLSLARQGKFKAFKFGADWLTTEAWLNDFHLTLRKNLEQEIKGSSLGQSPWVGRF